MDRLCKRKFNLLTLVMQKHDGWIQPTAKRQIQLNPKAQSRTCGGGRGQSSACARKQ